jgi:hypothetical protein
MSWENPMFTIRTLLDMKETFQDMHKGFENLRRVVSLAKCIPSSVKSITKKYIPNGI